MLGGSIAVLTGFRVILSGSMVVPGSPRVFLDRFGWFCGDSWVAQGDF